MLQQVEAILNRTRSIRDLVLTEVTNASPQELTTRPGTRWSARDVLVHIGNWEEVAVEWLPYFLKGEQPPHQEQKPIDELNAEMLARYEHLDMDGTVAYIQEMRLRWEALAGQITEEQWNRNVLGLLLMCPDHEIGHLHQLREAISAARGDAAEAAVHNLRYTRQRVLTRLNLEHRPVEALTWRPAEGKWSVRETLIHLAVWDRFAARVFAAIAEGRPVPVMPFPEGGLDLWNEAQVNAQSWMTLADVFHELGAAREELESQVRRLTPARFESREAQEWLGYRDHDKHHMNKMLKTLAAWRQAGH